MAIQAATGSSINRAKISLPRALPKSARMKVENAIEQHLSAVDALTAFLDQVDGDHDYEDGADHEPWLGRPEVDCYGVSAGSLTGTDDREFDVADDGEPDTEREEPLGWSDDIDQRGIASNVTGVANADQIGGAQWL